jgi:NAD(P)-dependent dehydrogenase (short-subunit alcohol dehydrogenase family)
MKALLPGMIAQRAGSVINIASVAGIEGAELLSHYSASKFAVVGLTQAAAKEVAPFGIRVNAVCPGLIRTPMQDREVIWEAELSGGSPEQIREGYVAMTPLARLGCPADVARLVTFLAADSSDFITGQSIHVDGGLRMR